MKHIPLTEVASLLSPQAAHLLTTQPLPLQVLVVTLLRDQIIYWESQGVSLDPVQFTAVVDGFVATMATVAKHFSP